MTSPKTDNPNISPSQLLLPPSSSSIISQFIPIIITHTADVLVSLCPFPHWVSFPWPITMTMGAGSMDTVTRQPAASASAAGTAVSCQSECYSGAAEKERERLSQPSSSSCMQVCSLTTEYYILHLSCLGSEASQHSTITMLTEIWTGIKRTLVRISKVRLKIAFNIDQSIQRDIIKITRFIHSVQNPNIYSVYSPPPKNGRRQHILTLGRLETLLNN